jgi:hypothetical protein
MASRNCGTLVRPADHQNEYKIVQRERSKGVFECFLVANRAAKFYIRLVGGVLQAEGHPFEPDTSHHVGSG